MSAKNCMVVVVSSTGESSVVTGVGGSMFSKKEAQREATEKSKYPGVLASYVVEEVLRVPGQQP